MFILKRHIDDYGHTETVSRHRSLKAAQIAKADDENRHPLPHLYRLTSKLFIVKPTTLITGTGRYTNAFYLIAAATHRDGATVTERNKGFSNYADLMALVTEGLLEVRDTGPRGGKRWHATRKGRRAVEAARVVLAVQVEAAS